MTVRRSLVAGLLAITPHAVVGCGGDRVKVEEIQVKEESALIRAKNALENYAKGQPLGSEASAFDQLIRDVKKEDAAKGEILEKGLADLQKAKGQTAIMAKAKELLNKLGFGK